jgi:uncharacterized protein YlxP (DUF503 family)
MAGMRIGWIELDVLLGDVHSLKEERPGIAGIRKHFHVSVGEVGYQGRHRPAELGVGMVAADRAPVAEVLDAMENHGAARPGIGLLSAGRRTITSED